MRNAKESKQQLTIKSLMGFLEKEEEGEEEKEGNKKLLIVKYSGRLSQQDSQQLPVHTSPLHYCRLRDYPFRCPDSRAAEVTVSCGISDMREKIHKI